MRSFGLKSQSKKKIMKEYGANQKDSLTKTNSESVKIDDSLTVYPASIDEMIRQVETALDETKEIVDSLDKKIAFVLTGLLGSAGYLSKLMYDKIYSVNQLSELASKDWYAIKAFGFILLIGLLPSILALLYAYQPKKFYRKGNSPLNWKPYISVPKYVAQGWMAQVYGRNLHDNEEVTIKKTSAFQFGLNWAVIQFFTIPLFWVTYYLLPIYQKNIIIIFSMLEVLIVAAFIFAKKIVKLFAKKDKNEK